MDQSASPRDGVASAAAEECLPNGNDVLGITAEPMDLHPPPWPANYDSEVMLREILLIPNDDGKLLPAYYKKKTWNSFSAKQMNKIALHWYKLTPDQKAGVCSRATFACTNNFKYSSEKFEGLGGRDESAGGIAKGDVRKASQALRKKEKERNLLNSLWDEYADMATHTLRSYERKLRVKVDLLLKLAKGEGGEELKEIAIKELVKIAFPDSSSPPRKVAKKSQASSPHSTSFSFSTPPSASFGSLEVHSLDTSNDDEDDLDA